MRFFGSRESSLTQPWKGLVLLFWLLPCVHSWKNTGKLYRTKALQVASCHLSFPASWARFSVLSASLCCPAPPSPQSLTPQCPLVLLTFDLCSRIPWRQYGGCGGCMWENWIGKSGNTPGMVAEPLWPEHSILLCFTH